MEKTHKHNIFVKHISSMLFVQLFFLISHDIVANAYTYKNTTRLEFLTSSEEARKNSLELEKAFKAFTPFSQDHLDLLHKYNYSTDGWEDRLKNVKRWIRLRRKKYYNNKTKKFESFDQKMAKMEDIILDELKFDYDDKDIQARERVLNDAEVAKVLGNHPNITFIPDLHAFTNYGAEYSGEAVKDDYNFKRKKRSVESNLS